MGQFQSASIQFIGAENVKTAFANVGEKNWALFNGKTLLEKYEGENPEESQQLFNLYVDSLESNGSTSLYRLQTYEDLPAGGKIKPSTEPDRSFQFKLYDVPGYGNPGNRINGADPLAKIMAKLDAMETKIAMLETEEDKEEEKVSGFGASIAKFLEIPAVQQKIAGVFENLVDQILPAKKPYNVKEEYTLSNPAVMNGVPSNDEAVQIEKINVSIQGLYEIDKKLGDNLEKLLAIAKADPSKYQLMISLLKNQF